MKQAKQRQLRRFTLSWFQRDPGASWVRHQRPLFMVCRKGKVGLPSVTLPLQGVDYYGPQLESTQ